MAILNSKLLVYQRVSEQPWKLWTCTTQPVAQICTIYRKTRTSKWKFGQQHGGEHPFGSFCADKHLPKFIAKLRDPTQKKDRHGSTAYFHIPHLWLKFKPVNYQTKPYPEGHTLYQSASHGAFFKRESDSLIFTISQGDNNSPLPKKQLWVDQWQIFTRHSTECAIYIGMQGLKDGFRRPNFKKVPPTMVF